MLAAASLDHDDWREPRLGSVLRLPSLPTAGSAAAAEPAPAATDVSDATSSPRPRKPPSGGPGGGGTWPRAGPAPEQGPRQKRSARKAQLSAA